VTATHAIAHTYLLQDTLYCGCNNGALVSLDPASLPTPEEALSSDALPSTQALPEGCAIHTLATCNRYILAAGASPTVTILQQPESRQAESGKEPPTLAAELDVGARAVVSAEFDNASGRTIVVGTSDGSLQLLEMHAGHNAVEAESKVRPSFQPAKNVGGLVLFVYWIGTAIGGDRGLSILMGKSWEATNAIKLQVPKLLAAKAEANMHMDAVDKRIMFLPVSSCHFKNAVGSCNVPKASTGCFVRRVVRVLRKFPGRGVQV
jgi:hypothetical protein